MAIKTSFTKLYWRIGCAVLATLVTTFVAIFAPASAQGGSATCSLSDVSAWQTQLVDAEEEVSPAYILRVTEDFLQACPDRPEAAEAYRIAGMAAADNGDAKTAVEHFDRAGWIYDTSARFYYAAALLADNYPEDAWRLRDLIAEEWAAALSANPRVDIDIQKLTNGTIYAVRFMKPDPQTGIGAAWVAIPDGPGWPATLTIGSDRQFTAFHRLRAGADAPALRHIDLYRCRGRRLLARTEAAIPTEDMDIAATVTMIGYLADPDLLEPTEAGQPLATCLWPGRLFPKAVR